MSWQRYIYGAHWKYHDKLYYDEFPADTKEGAAKYFNSHKRDDVTLVRIEMVRPITLPEAKPDRFRPSAN